jgi:hypothetical protein
LRLRIREGIVDRLDLVALGQGEDGLRADEPHLAE